MPELSDFIKGRAETLALLSGFKLDNADHVWFTTLAKRAMWDAVNIAQKQTVAQSEDKDGK